jgi:hypothetical protein
LTQVLLALEELDDLAPPQLESQEEANAFIKAHLYNKTPFGHLAFIAKDR